MFGLSRRQILIVLVVIALLYTAAQYMPAYVAAFQLNDYIRQEVKYAATSRKTMDVLRADIVRKATDLEIPVKTRDIRITRRGPSFTLELDYRWPSDMKLSHPVFLFHMPKWGKTFENF